MYHIQWRVTEQLHTHVAIPPAVRLESHPTGNTQEVTPAPIPETGMGLTTKGVFPQIPGFGAF